MALAVVRDLRELRLPVTGEELADFRAGFVLARASAGQAPRVFRGQFL